MEGNDIKQVGVVLKLDKERHLVFDLNAFCELEDKYGSMEKALDEMGKGSMKAIRLMLYLGLSSEDETLTEKQVGRLINVETLPSVMNSITLAAELSTPKPDSKQSGKN